MVRKVGVKSRPRRTSPKLPERLTVDWRVKSKPELWLAPLPVSLSTCPSSQKLAARPSPRSSLPRKPSRLVEFSPEIMPVVWPAPVALIEPTPASTTPNIVTEDCARAAPDAASKASVMADFFISDIPVGG